MDDFQELDDLLKESVAIASAKKAKAQGKKLSTKQSLIIEEIKKVDERALWEDQIAYAHLNALQCKCGDYIPSFQGYYLYQLAKYGSGRRLVRVVEVPPGIQIKGLHTTTPVDSCYSCIEASINTWADVSECDLLGELVFTPKEESLIPTSTRSHAIEEDLLEIEEALTELNPDEPDDILEEDEVE